MAGFGKRTGLQTRNGGPGFGKSAGLTPMSNEPRVQANGNAETPKRAHVDIDAFVERLESQVLSALPREAAKMKSRGELTQALEEQVHIRAATEGMELKDADFKDVVTVLLNLYLEEVGGAREDPLSPSSGEGKKARSKNKNTLEDAKETIQPLLFEHIDPAAATELERTDLAEEISDVVSELLVETKINLNKKEQRDLVTLLLNDMLGLGPLEPLLADETITDIMVNGPNQIYVEQGGKLQLTDVKFRDSQHLMNIATRIVTAIGRRVDETQPICDARLADGSRVNVIIPPLAIDGASISIRKFAKKKITLDRMVETQNLSEAMSRVLKIAGRCRLNILISGGTGSGKTTMLNAISRMIESGERVVTIEDAAELQLQQPHVVRLETRPPNLEGHGEITMRDLVKNALRMRPDRIILGEIRGSEAIDMLQAMNTGHDGSLGTLHANRPREALTRLENMVNMAGLNLPTKAIRTQIADALHMIVQVSRMRDGVRRVQYISEVVGMEEDVITTQDLFVYRFTGENDQGELQGEFQCTGVRPKFYDRAEYYGLGRSLMEAIQ